MAGLKVPLTFPLTGTLSRPLNTLGRWPGGAADLISPLFANGEQGMWYDWTDTSTIFQDFAGTIPWTTSGQYVGTILDKSGNGNHMHFDGTSRPVLTISGELYILGLDGIDDRGATDNVIDFGGASKCCTFMAYKPVSPSVVGIIFQTNGNTRHEFSYSSAVQRDGLTGVSGLGSGYVIGDVSSTPYFAKQCVLSIENDLSAGTSAGKIQMRRNGSAESITYDTYLSIASSFANSNLIFSDAAYPFQGGMYGGFIQRYAPCTVDEVATVEAWLNTRSGAY